MNILLFDSEARWVEGGVSLWRDRLQLNPRLRMCLASGHTPLKLYDALADSCARGETTLQECQIFALDDFGGLALNDPGRCPAMIVEHLLKKADLPKEEFHTIDTESPDLDSVCREFDRKIGAGFDLAILGVGMNGHLGLNEPGSSPESGTRRVDLHPATIQASAKYLSHSKLPTWGVGVGLKQLLGSKEVWLLANGEKKADIVRRAIKGEITPDVPVTLLRKHPNVWFMLDAAAARLLNLP